MINMLDVNLSKVLQKNSVDAELLKKIAEVLEVPVSYFFEENGELPEKKENTINNGGNNVNGVNHGTVHNGNVHNSTEVKELEYFRRKEEEIKAQFSNMQKEIEWLKIQINKLEKDKEFLQKMMEKMNEK